MGESGRVCAFIGLGSNLESPIDQIYRAFEELDELPVTQLKAKSSLYRSPPLGPQDQPWYVNAVAELETRLAPLSLLDELQRIETGHARRTTRRWGPRTLDLDILLYEQLRVDTARLTIPHVGLAKRTFVLLPLLDLAPDLDVPGLGPAQALLVALPEGRLQRI